MVLKGHTGSVLCLQYNEQVIVTGSSDSTIRYVCVCGGALHAEYGTQILNSHGFHFECDEALFPW